MSDTWVPKRGDRVMLATEAAHLFVERNGRPATHADLLLIADQFSKSPFNHDDQSYRDGGIDALGLLNSVKAALDPNRKTT